MLRFFDKSITHFVILSRCVEGKVNLGFSSNIFNVSSTVGDVTLYFEDINMNSRKIKNLGGPTNDGDAINKKYLEGVALTLDGSNVMTGDLRMGQKKIIGLADPTGDGQATNKKYVDTENAKQDIAINDKASKSYVDGEIAKVHIDTTPLLPRDGSRSMTGDLDIGGNNILSVENLVDYKDTDPYDYRVKDVKSVVNKEYLNENFMKKVDKDGIEYYDLKGNIIRNCEPYYDGLFTDNDLVSKKYVQTEIAKLPKPATDLLKLDGSKAMTGNLDMGDHTITGIRSSAADNAALTVGGAKATYFPLLGDRSMQGNLNMGGFAITNIKPFVEDDSSQAASDAQRNEVINFGYFHTERGELKRLINSVSSNALNRKNPDLMEDDIDMANHSIINLKDPKSSDSSYAASVNFVNNTVNGSNVIINGIIDKKIQESEERSIRAVQQENVFEKVMVDDLFILDDDDIKKVAVVDKDFHKINQQTYLFKIDYDSEIGYYSTRLGVKFIYRNLIRNDSKLFLIKELYFPDSVQGRTQNNYTYQTNDDNKGDATFYLTFQHKATTSDSMIITLHWEGGIPSIHILISKDRVVVSKNLLINEPSLKSYNILSYFKGKYLYLWIRIQNNVIKINFSGSRTISTTHPNIQNKDENLSIIYVSDSPFTIQRGLITKNIYNQNSDAFEDVREYEISEGTFINAN